MTSKPSKVLNPLANLPPSNKGKDAPFIQDFQFYKHRFQKRYKEIKLKVGKLADSMEKLATTFIASDVDADIEKTSAQNKEQRQQIATRLIDETTSLKKEIEELSEILESLSKQSEADGSAKNQQAEKATLMKFKSQLKDLQTQFSQLKKLFKQQVKAMALFQRPTGDPEVQAPSNGVKNRKNKKLQGLSDESGHLDSTIQMAQDIISSGQESAQSLHGQSQKLKGTKGKLDKIAKEGVKQADKLITKIGSREKKNTIIIAFVISCCLAFFIYHYNFLGLGIIKQWTSSSSTPSTPPSAATTATDAPADSSSGASDTLGAASSMMNSFYGVAKDVAKDVAGKISNISASLTASSDEGVPTVESKPKEDSDEGLNEGTKKSKSFSMSIEDIEEVHSQKREIAPEPEEPTENAPVADQEGDSSPSGDAQKPEENEPEEDFDPWDSDSGRAQVMNSKFRKNLRKKGNDKASKTPRAQESEEEMRSVKPKVPIPEEKPEMKEEALGAESKSGSLPEESTELSEPQEEQYNPYNDVSQPGEDQDSQLKQEQDPAPSQPQAEEKRPPSSGLDDQGDRTDATSDSSQTEASSSSETPEAAEPSSESKSTTTDAPEEKEEFHKNKALSFLKKKLIKQVDHGNTELQTATAQVLNNEVIRTQVPLSEADPEEDEEDEDDDDEIPSGESRTSHQHIGGRLNLKPSFGRRSMNKFELPEMDEGPKLQVKSVAEKVDLRETKEMKKEIDDKASGGDTDREEEKKAESDLEEGEAVASGAQSPWSDPAEPTDNHVLAEAREDKETPEQPPVIESESEPFVDQEAFEDTDPVEIPEGLSDEDLLKAATVEALAEELDLPAETEPTALQDLVEATLKEKVAQVATAAQDEDEPKHAEMAESIEDLTSEIEEIEPRLLTIPEDEASSAGFIQSGSEEPVETVEAVEPEELVEAIDETGAELPSGESQAGSYGAEEEDFEPEDLVQPQEPTPKAEKGRLFLNEL